MAIVAGLLVATAILGLALALRLIVLTLRVALDRPASGGFAQSPANDDDLPAVTVIVPAHNEESVIGQGLAAMLDFDYPRDRLSILVIDDRSTDGTAAVVAEVAVPEPRLRLLRRPPTAPPGKAAAIADAMPGLSSDVIVLFDADYLPSPGLLKQLVAPFRDPRVGATMGRVVPYNSDRTLLAGILDLERRAGYAADQQGRALLGLVPQFGGTVGGIRRRALEEVGGWRPGALAEDTDLTFRLALAGYRIAYLNDAPCHEEAPESWRSRYRQVRRWTTGHNECLIAYFHAVLTSRRLDWAQKLDAALVLLTFTYPALAGLCLLAAPVVLAEAPATSIAVAPVLALAILAPYIAIYVTAERDAQPGILRLLPLLPLSSAISMLASIDAVAALARHLLFGKALAWDKTPRFRQAA